MVVWSIESEFIDQIFIDMTQFEDVQLLRCQLDVLNGPRSIWRLYLQDICEINQHELRDVAAVIAIGV